MKAKPRLPVSPEEQRYADRQTLFLSDRYRDLEEEDSRDQFPSESTDNNTTPLGPCVHPEVSNDDEDGGVDEAQAQQQQQQQDEKHLVRAQQPCSSSSQSYCPTAAWEVKRPVKYFGWRGCLAARTYARKHKLAMFALQVSDARLTMNYVVGPWSTVADAVLDGKMNEAHHICRLNLENPLALKSIYECVLADQRCLPVYDIEYYANREHGNELRKGDFVIDKFSRTVAYMTTALLCELFPDQVTYASEQAREKTLAGYAPAPDDSVEQKETWPSRGLIRKHYRSPTDLTAPPAQLDPETHWNVLDASLGAKRSQHLILDPSADIYWDTQVDQAIFVGLLYRRIYRAAFDESTDQNVCDKFRKHARDLFIMDKTRKDKLCWALPVDSVVYKKLQLIRTLFSTKRGQNRPFLYRPDVFPDNPISQGAATPSQMIDQTLLGRVPQGRCAQGLSFARCYPGMFPEQRQELRHSENHTTGHGVAHATANWLPSSAYQLALWRFVPNYTTGGVTSLPVLLHPPKVPKARGPWRNSQSCEAVAAWLRRTDPLNATMDASVVGGGWVTSPSSAPEWCRVSSSGPQSPFGADLELDATQVPNCNDLPSPRTPAEAVAYFVCHVRELHPWLSEAGGLQELAQRMVVKTSWKLNKKTGRKYHTALASPNLFYCPIAKVKHESGHAYLLIGKRYGSVSVRCLAEKCKGARYRPGVAMLREHARMVFAKPSTTGATEAGKGETPNANADSAQCTNDMSSVGKRKQHPQPPFPSSSSASPSQTDAILADNAGGSHEKKARH